MERLIRSMIVLFAVLMIAASVSAQGGFGGMSSGSSATRSHSLDTSAPGDGVGGPMYPQGSIMALNRQVRILLSQMEQLVIEVKAAEENLQQARRAREIGQGSQTEVNTAEVALAGVRSQIQQVEVQYGYVQLLVSLAKPVSVDLKHADIRQAAEVLSKISSVAVTVDKVVPNDVFVTAQAENVPLAGVLEVIANSAGLMIEPFESGVKLSKPAKFTVNGKTTTYDYLNWPWSDEWSFGGGGGYGGTIPVGQRWLGLYSAKIETTTPPQQPAKSVTASSSVTLAGVGGNMLVVAEPGVGPQGEPGFWLTLYRLEKDRFVAGGKTFHRSLGAQPVPKASGSGGGGGSTGPSYHW